MVLVRHFIRGHHHVCRCTLRTLSPLISLLGTPTNHTGMSQTRLLPPPRRRHAAMAKWESSHVTNWPMSDRLKSCTKERRRKDKEKWDNEPPPRLPRRRILLDPCAYYRPTDHTFLICRDLMMCHALGFVQIRQSGVLYAIFQLVCTFFMRAAADVLPVIRQWFRPLLAKTST
jgi:hypothetical protein